MIRNLLATTAIAALMATGAHAQTTPPVTAQPGATMPAQAPMVKKAEGHLASTIIGKRVYNGTGDQAENIGTVNDIVIGPDGQVNAVVVGVGGFLGLGQKNVALEYSLAQFVERDNDEWIVVETTGDALKALPEFDLAAFQFRPADTVVGQTAPATASDLAMAAPRADGAAPAAGAPATDTMAAAPMAPAGTAVTDDTRTAAIDRSTLNEIQLNEIRADDFIGTTVYGANDENVGSVGDIIMSADGGAVDAVILDVGGFLGMGTKEVALGLDNLHFMRDADGKLHVYTRLTREQLEAQPAYDETGYMAGRDTMRIVVPN